jgi:hypothetical protein
MIKVYIDNNYLVIDYGNNKQYNASASQVVVKEINTEVGKESVAFYNVPEMDPHKILVADLVDESDVPYTIDSFRTFYRSKTGKGTSITTLTQEEYDALPQDVQNDGTTYLIV